MSSARTPITRYVALGDSSTEGLEDPDGRGGYRGWSRRLAARIAQVDGDIEYTNLGVRGLTTREILRTQLDEARALAPDLVTIFSGTNDVIRLRFDVDRITRDMETIQRTFTGAGARVLTFTLPELATIMPIARLVSRRVRAVNGAIRASAARSGATLLDFATYSVATDPRLWHEDRLHANAEGHARIADALAFALRLPGSDRSWAEDLPPVAPPTMEVRIRADLRWMRRYLAPWVTRSIHSRVAGSPLTQNEP